MSDLAFGARVLVRADAARVIAEPHDDTHRFKQAVGALAGRYVLHDFELGDCWPGEPIDETWDAPPMVGYPVTPLLNGRVMARVRRFPFEPETGIVVGFTQRIEGIIATVDGSTNLYPPNRTIPLVEVALAPPNATGKARFVLVHRHDLAVIR